MEVGSESGLTSLFPKLASFTYSMACTSDIQGSPPLSWDASAPALPLVSECYWVSFPHLPGLNLSMITQASVRSHLMQSRRIIPICLSLASLKMWTLPSLVPSYTPGLGDSHLSPNIGGDRWSPRVCHSSHSLYLRPRRGPYFLNAFSTPFILRNRRNDATCCVDELAHASWFQKHKKACFRKLMNWNTVCCGHRIMALKISREYMEPGVAPGSLVLGSRALVEWRVEILSQRIKTVTCLLCIKG